MDQDMFLSFWKLEVEASSLSYPCVHVQVLRLEMTWRALRRNHTESAILFEKKLKPFVNSLNDGDGECWCWRNSMDVTHWVLSVCYVYMCACRFGRRGSHCGATPGSSADADGGRGPGGEQRQRLPAPLRCPPISSERCAARPGLSAARTHSAHRYTHAPTTMSCCVLFFFFPSANLVIQVLCSEGLL